MSTETAESILFADRALRGKIDCRREQALDGTSYLVFIKRRPGGDDIERRFRIDGDTLSQVDG